MVGRVLDAAGPGPIRVVSLCAGQGRDVIDVVAGHARRADVAALLVELDPELVAIALERAAAAGVSGQVRVVAGDASLAAVYAGSVPAHLVLVCGVFGNIADPDIAATVAALPGFCAPGASVVWTRHRRPPDATPWIRQAFVAAGFEEVVFEAPPAPYVLSVGWHRQMGAPQPFDPKGNLFEFVGDGNRPA
jgi:predicted RNA methylase